MQDTPLLKIEPRIEESWKILLKSEFEKPYFCKIKNFLLEEKAQGHTVYPKGAHIFEAFARTPVARVKVVILGQDPYHGPNQAHGLSFSVQAPCPPPPSLLNIFKELKTDLGISIPESGDLSTWADRGVLLLNTVLTVRAHSPASHRDAGWQHFTDAVIQNLCKTRQNLVFILWGKDAQAKKSLISLDHFVIESAHPSPMSATRGFLGSRPFSRANAYLQAHGHNPIDWIL